MSTITKRNIRLYFKGILISIDQLANAVLGGYPDETLSSRIYRKSNAGQKFWKVLNWIVDKIFFWDKNHCEGAYINELISKYSPSEVKDF